MGIEEQTERAESKLRRVFRTGRLNGVDLGITRGHDVRWGDPVNPGWYGIPGGNRKFVVEPATVDVDGFLNLQRSTFDDPTDRSFFGGAYDETVKRAEETLQFGTGEVPTPVIEIRTDGTVVQEGRSRAIGARRAGVDRMPVYVAQKVYR